MLDLCERNPPKHCCSKCGITWEHGRNADIYAMLQTYRTRMCIHKIKFMNADLQEVLMLNLLERHTVLEKKKYFRIHNLIHSLTETLS